MDYEEIKFWKEGNRGAIMLNRPTTLNAYTSKTEEELRRAVAEAEEDDEIKVLVVTGNGRGFCSGHDNNEVKATVDQSQGKLDVSFNVKGYPPAIFMSVTKPLIGAINGVTAGGGLAIALACDIRIASENALFYETHVSRVGTTPGLEVMLLPRLIGIDRALEMMYTGRKVGAEEAERIGLVTKVVPHDKLMETVNELANGIAVQPLWALRLSKKAVRQGLGMPMEETMSYIALARKICSQPGIIRQEYHS